MTDVDGDGYGAKVAREGATMGTDCTMKTAVLPALRTESTSMCMTDQDGDGYGHPMLHMEAMLEQIAMMKIHNSIHKIKMEMDLAVVLVIVMIQILDVITRRTMMDTLLRWRL